MADMQTSSGPVTTRDMPVRAAERDLRDRLGLAGVKLRPHAPPATTRRKVIEGLKTFLWVAPLTVMIWIYAEREQLAPLADVRVPITVRAASSDRIVTQLSDDHYIYLDLEGPRGSLDRVRDALADSKIPLEITTSEDPGFQGPIAIADRLAKSDNILSRNAVRVSRARPSSVAIKVEAKATRAFAIKTRPGDKFVGTVAFEPDTITVQGPKSVLDPIAVDDAVVYADLSRFAGRKPDHYEEDVDVAFPFPAENVTLQKKTVRAKVDLKASEPYAVPSMLVLVHFPAGLLDNDRYKTKVSPLTLTNVEVTGPPDSIKLLKDRKFIATVVVELTEEQWRTPGEKTVGVKAENYHLPKDVTVLNPGRDITVTLSERAP